ncbi:uncharacterized protein LOC126379181 [Pectinophora gossypiella]|uniref:uncharacterized protein LOC126379181 n=1 Tax=Pectinophora gossypiella TaxID=13191 RepID=UPI00214EB26C|nr:uncharacterized protein LOC126379181 [Pectinophora gossypiella]
MCTRFRGCSVVCSFSFDLAFPWYSDLQVYWLLLLCYGLTTLAVVIWTPTLLVTWILLTLCYIISFVEAVFTMDDPTPGPSREIAPPPPKIRKRSQNLTANEKLIALNVHAYVEKSMSTYPFKREVDEITADIMRTSTRTIRNIIKEKRTMGTTSSPQKHKDIKKIVDKLDDFTLSAIRLKIHQYYFDGELPTIKKVLTAVNEDDNLPNFTLSTMYKIMKKLNFKYAKRSRKSVLLDRPDLQVWRIIYIHKISDYRKENKKIYYLDETWVNEGHTVDHVWMDDDIKSSRDAFLRGLSTGLKNPAKGRRLIVTHIGNENGFLEGADWVFEAKKSDGDYHGEMDSHNFEKWFQETLEKIEPGSVIVMDNASYHSRKVDLLPNMGWRKTDIQNWLQSKNIDFEENEIKAQLLQKINKMRYQQKHVDEMAAKKDIIVLRLPPYHCELNPIELIWAQMKSYVARNNKSFKMAEVKKLLSESMARIGKEQWTACVNHVLKEEEKMKRLEGLIDDATDGVTPKFIIHISEDSSSHSESFDDDSDKEN